MFELKVTNHFAAAHQLEMVAKKCENVHGHSFQVEVRVLVTELDKTGIGIDFATIKAALIAILPDHTLLNEVYEFNPTAENLAHQFYTELKSRMPVQSVTVWESQDASATYSEDP